MSKSVPAYPHLHPKAIPWLERSDADRIEYIKNEKHFQETHVIQDAMKIIDLIMGQGRGKRRRNFQLVGPSGIGKSTILWQIQSRHPPALIAGSLTYSRPVVIFVMTSIRSIDEFLSHLEEKAGMPTRTRRASPLKRAEEIAEHLNKALCILAAFDEFQDLKDVARGVRSHIVQLIKKIAEIAEFPMCVAGSKDSLTVLSDCGHMKTRFRTQVARNSWTNDKEFHTWFFGLIGRYPLKVPSKIFDKSTMGTLVARSDGCTETIVFAAKTCAEEAIVKGTESIDRNRLLELALL